MNFPTTAHVLLFALIGVAAVLVEGLAVLQIFRYFARKRENREAGEMFTHLRKYWKD